MTSTTIDNGVNVKHLLGARQLITETPELGRFTWRATNTWVGGTHSRGGEDDPCRHNAHLLLTAAIEPQSREYSVAQASSLLIGASTARSHRHELL